MRQMLSRMAVYGGVKMIDCVPAAPSTSARRALSLLRLSALSLRTIAASLHAQHQTTRYPSTQVALSYSTDARDSLADSGERRRDDTSNRGVYQFDGMQRRQLGVEAPQRRGDL